MKEIFNEDNGRNEERIKKKKDIILLHIRKRLCPRHIQNLEEEKNDARLVVPTLQIITTTTTNSLKMQQQEVFSLFLSLSLPDAFVHYDFPLCGYES